MTGDSISTYDFIIKQGATFSRSLTYNSGGSPVDLTGYTAAMQVRDTVGSANVLLNLTTANGGIIISAPSTGVIVLFASATTTSALSFVDGVYDLEITSGSGVVSRILQGNISLDLNVTRS